MLCDVLATELVGTLGGGHVVDQSCKYGSRRTDRSGRALPLRPRFFPDTDHQALLDVIRDAVRSDKPRPSLCLVGEDPVPER